MRKFAIVAIVAAGMVGCSTPPVAPDITPLLPTATLEIRVVNEGMQGLFPYQSTHKSYLRANMRRDDVTVKGTGTVTKYVVGTTTETRIWNLERNLLWVLDPDKKEYRECPLTGCAAAVKPAKQDEQAPPLYESGCSMKITDSSITLTPTGKKRTISGFNTDEYSLEWKVTLRDVIARKSTSTLSASIWTTSVMPSLRQVLGVEQAYARAFAGKVPGADAVQLLPPEITQMIGAGLAGALSPSDRVTFANAGRQFDLVKGHPISTRVEWKLRGEACAPKAVPTVGGLAAIPGVFSKKKKEEAAAALANKPILSFLIEVNMIKMDLARDSMFGVPQDYKLTK